MKLKSLLTSLAVAALGLLPVAAHADLVKQNAACIRTVLMTDSADHISGKTGLTLTVKLAKAGGSYATITPTVTDQGGGRYAIALTATHTNTLGALDLQITAVGADPSDTHDQIVAFDPNDGAALGLSRLDASVSSRSTYTGSDTAGTTTLLARIPSFPTGFSSLLIGSGGDAGKVTTSNPATGGSGGATASEVVNLLLGTELVPGYTIRRALYTGGSGIPVSEGKPGVMTANPASSGAYPASVAPWYQDVVYYRVGESAPSGTVVWTNRTYYKSDKTSVVGRTAIVGTLPN